MNRQAKIRIEWTSHNRTTFRYVTLWVQSSRTMAEKNLVAITIAQINKDNPYPQLLVIIQYSPIHASLLNKHNDLYSFTGATDELVWNISTWWSQWAHYFHLLTEEVVVERGNGREREKIQIQDTWFSEMYYYLSVHPSVRPSAIHLFIYFFAVIAGRSAFEDFSGFGYSTLSHWWMFLTKEL